MYTYNIVNRHFSVLRTMLSQLVVFLFACCNSLNLLYPLVSDYPKPWIRRYLGTTYERLVGEG